MAFYDRLNRRRLSTRGMGLRNSPLRSKAVDDLKGNSDSLLAAIGQAARRSQLGRDGTASGEIPNRSNRFSIEHEHCKDRPGTQQGTGVTENGVADAPSQNLNGSAVNGSSCVSTARRSVDSAISEEFRAELLLRLERKGLLARGSRSARVQAPPQSSAFVSNENEEETNQNAWCKEISDSQHLTGVSTETAVVDATSKTLSAPVVNGTNCVCAARQSIDSAVSDEFRAELLLRLEKKGLIGRGSRSGRLRTSSQSSAFGTNDEETNQNSWDLKELWRSIEQMDLTNIDRGLYVRVSSADMAMSMQLHAVRVANEVMEKFGASSLMETARELKKEFDRFHGHVWHCIVGASYGSFVTHSLGGFICFSIGKYSFLLFKTSIP